MKNNWVWTGFALMGLVLGACADKNLDDQKAADLAKDLAEYKAVEGDYTNTVTSKVDNRTLGALTISLKAATRTVPGQNGEKASAEPVLLSTVKFTDGTQSIHLSSTSSTYYPSTKQYQATASIVRQGSNQSEEISITGTIDNNTLQGELDASRYIGYGARFALVKNGATPALDGQGSSSSPLKDDSAANALIVKKFQGTTTFTNGSQWPVAMTILAPRKSSDEDFLNLFVPLRDVQVAMNYGNSVRASFGNARWDERNGTIVGEAVAWQNSTGDIKSYDFSLQCQAAGSGTSSMTCQYVSALTGGKLATTALNPASSAEPGRDDLPGENPSNGQAVVANFSGTGELAPNQQIPVKLNVVYPARTKLQELIELLFNDAEKKLQVTLQFWEGDTAFRAMFDSANWDSTTGTLSGVTQSTSSSGVRTEVTLKCSAFYFEKTIKPFSCQYYSNQRTTPIGLSFKPN